jgi:hypothetical protein
MDGHKTIKDKISIMDSDLPEWVEFVNEVLEKKKRRRAKNA